MRLYYASDLERRAVEWCRHSYGRGWRKRISQSIAEGERYFRGCKNLTGYAFCVARPFGSREMNVLQQAARHCLRRNTHFRVIAKAIGRVS